MKCKIPIIKFKNTRITKQGIELPVMLDDEKKKLPEYLQVGQAWKVFGKWLVAMGQSDQNEIEFPDGTLKSGHVCIVLRGIGFTLYFYELIDDYTEEQLKIFNYIRLVLDRVLVTNQVASIKLRFFLEKFASWKGNVFPKFFNTFNDNKIAEWSNQIDEEIEQASKIKYVYKKIGREKYWTSIIKPKNKKDLWDIKGCYTELLSIFNTIKSDLPQENIKIIDELITRCEHGYFLGFLLEKTIQEYERKHPNIKNSNQATRTETYLRRRLTNFRKGRESKVMLASKEAFGLSKQVKKKLKRMFEIKKI